MIHRMLAGMIVVIIAGMFIFGFRASCGTQASVSVGRELRAGLENPYLLRSADGRAMLGIVVEPPEAAGRRSPTSLALVIDTSGSMQGEKIEHARSASHAIVNALTDDDEVSLTAFEQAAYPVVPLVRVDAATRKRLHEAIAGLHDGGGTALHDGLVMGLGSLGSAHNPSRRLLLISDGQGNIGPSTKEAIVAAIAPKLAGVTLSAIGVGTDYDEAVLTAIATRGAGSFHHLADPVQLTKILEIELLQAHQVVAQNAAIEIQSAPGVTVLDEAGLPLERQPDGRVRIRIGDLYRQERRSLAIPILVPAGDAAERAAGTVRLTYAPMGGGQARVREVGVRYATTTSAEQVARGAVPEFMVAADRTRASHALNDAAELLKQGDLIEAQNVLQDERKRLENRRDRLSGRERADVDALIAMLRDPYVDAQAPTHGAQPAFEMLVDCARRGDPLPEANLAGLDGAKLRILRNVPYARHGYPFKTPELQRQFASLGWYHEDPSFDNARLTHTDADNVALVHAYEGRATLHAALATVAAKKPRIEPLLARAERGESLAGADLAGLDLRQLRLLRNTAYARHGYVFRSADLKAAFAQKLWYRADPTYAESRLTDRDNENIRLVQDRERELLASVAGEAVRDFELRSRAAASRALRQ